MGIFFFSTFFILTILKTTISVHSFVEVSLSASNCEEASTSWLFPVDVCLPYLFEEPRMYQSNSTHVQISIYNNSFCEGSSKAVVEQELFICNNYDFDFVNISSVLYQLIVVEDAYPQFFSNETKEFSHLAFYTDILCETQVDLDFFTNNAISNRTLLNSHELEVDTGPLKMKHYCDSDSFSVKYYHYNLSSSVDDIFIEGFNIIYNLSDGECFNNYSKRVFYPETIQTSIIDIAYLAEAGSLKKQCLSLDEFESSPIKPEIEENTFLEMAYYFTYLCEGDPQARFMYPNGYCDYGYSVIFDEFTFHYVLYPNTNCTGDFYEIKSVHYSSNSFCGIYYDFGYKYSFLRDPNMNNGIVGLFVDDCDSYSPTELLEMAKARKSYMTHIFDTVCIFEQRVEAQYFFPEHTKSIKGKCERGKLSFENYTMSTSCDNLHMKEENLCLQKLDGAGFFIFVCMPYYCDSISEFDENVCSGHGNCEGTDNCSCDAGYQGEWCQQSYIAVIVSVSILAFFGLTSLTIVILCCCGLLLFVIVLLLLLVFFTKRRFQKIKRFESLKNINLLLKEQALAEKGMIADIEINREVFNISNEDIHMISLIGAGGSHSKVFKVEYNSEIYAYKSFMMGISSLGGEDEKDRKERIKEDLKEFEREVFVLANFRHKNILGFFGACIKPPRIGFLMEFCEKGDLKQFLINFRRTHPQKQGFPFPEKMRIIQEIASAMSFLHSKNVIHRDLKLENVLVDDHEITKLMDFGMSRNLDNPNDSFTRGIGTSVYMSPELIRGEPYDWSVDVYAFGILCFIVLSEKFKCYGEEEEGIEYKVANNPFYRPFFQRNDNHSLCPKGSLTTRMKKLIKTCWNHDSKMRPNFVSILQYLRKIQMIQEKESSIVIYFLASEDSSKKNLEELEAEDYLLKEKTIKALDAIFRTSKSFNLTTTTKEEEESKKECKDKISCHYGRFIEKQSNLIPLLTDEDVNRLVREDSLIVYIRKNEQNNRGKNSANENHSKIDDDRENEEFVYSLQKRIKELEKENEKLRNRLQFFES